MTTSGYDDFHLYIDIVTVLTRAATSRHIDGTARDFADFLTHVLAATAANVGGPDHLLAGRPGSREAAHLEELVRGAMGDDRADWLWFRTAPVTVGLNVAELVEDDLTHPGLMGLDEALETLGKHHESAAVNPDLDAWERDIEVVTARYTHEYLVYAERFTTAARAYTQQLAGLTVPLEVDADTSPYSRWWTATAITNPTTSAGDALALRIWRAAHDATPLPNVDVWLGPSTLAKTQVRS